MPALSPARSCENQRPRAAQRLLEFDLAVAAGSAHGPRIVQEQDDGDGAFLADSEPDGVRQAEDEKGDEQNAGEQREPFAEPATGIEARVDAMKEHERWERARVLSEAEEKMENERERRQRQQGKEERIKRREAVHNRLKRA